MATLVLRFPSGRYHATPSGHHVNEGLVEWPPSPWRLLRALIATGYATQHWRDVPDAARRLLLTLASELPTYRLPISSVAHSRHYMPLGVLDKSREKTTLVLDAWANVGDGELAVRWPCSLDAEPGALLERLAVNLGYLGRSESWVEARSVGDDLPLPAGIDVTPHEEGARLAGGLELVRLLAPETPDDYAAWRASRLETERAAKPPPKGRKGARTSKSAVSPALVYPEDLLDALQRDTAWWKQLRWSAPPGSREVLYARPVDALTVSPPARPARRSPPPVTTMLLALTTPSGSRSALPVAARALPQAELLHQALVARAGGGGRVDCPELTGRDTDGRVLTGHKHAHLLPVDLDEDGHLDHIVIYAPGGLGPRAQQAVRAVRRTWTKGSVGDLHVALAGAGAVQDLRDLPVPLRGGVHKLLGAAVCGARIWRSATPFVPPRHLKARGRNTLAGQVAAELASRGLPDAAVEVIPWNQDTLPLRHFIRVRQRRGVPPPADMGFALQLVFPEPVPGPLALGYAAHFGLGRFAAVEG